jgi:hypothetical protein
MKNLIIKAYTSNAFLIILGLGFFATGMIVGVSSLIEKEREVLHIVPANNTCEGGFEDGTAQIKCVDQKGKLGGGWLNLTKTEKLTINSSDLKTIDALQNLTEVNKDLDLSGNKIEDIYGLKSLQKVGGILNLNHNNIAEVGALKSLKSAEWILISGSNLRSIDGLGNLEKVEDLDLSFNLIRLTRGLSNLKEVNNLNLSNNYIASLSGLRNIEKVNGSIYLQKNPFIVDLSDLNKMIIGEKIFIDNRAYPSKLSAGSNICLSFKGKVFDEKGEEISTDYKLNFCETGKEGIK